MKPEIMFLTTFFIALITALFLTPKVEEVAVKFNAMDKPDARKVHSKLMPRWGGLAIAMAAILSILLCFRIFEQAQLLLDIKTQKNLLGLFLGGGLMVIVGMIDDKFNLSAKYKLLGQILIALVVMKFGIAITFLTLPFIGFVYLPGWLSVLLTILWIVGMTNAINLLDGLDGLLAGVATIFALLFFAVSLLTGQIAVAITMIAIAGACVGFLRYNFNPARIFMGDTGSLFLGLMFACLSIIGAFKVTTTAAMIIPVVIMGLPIFDTSFAIVRRFAHGKPIFSPDKEHVHHQLLARGLSVRQTVLLIYLICCTLGVAGLSVALFWN
jgi:UDP-GlcNAc:undecaprenyl-phosphate/decaprenyl-phosphate GlcNAc-1-phosphate transferase